MRAVILGIGSDIGREVGGRLQAVGWTVLGLHHDEQLVFEAWDLLVCCYGTLEPVGPFWVVPDEDWEGAFRANLFLPLRQVRALYPYRRAGAAVCFFSGAGTSGPAPTYSAYAASKVALVKVAELLDDESPDCKFFVLGPGIVRTKIHDQTTRAGPLAANLHRVGSFLASDDPGTSHDDIFGCLMACFVAPKEALGGRNVYVPRDDVGRLAELAADPNLFKLRRYGDEAIRRSR